MAKIRRGKRRPKRHDGEIEYLIAFLGGELLSHVQRITQITNSRETIEVAGKLMRGYFTLRVTFDGRAPH